MLPYLEQANLYRERMLEGLAEYDDVFMGRYLEGKTFASEELHALIRRATLAAHITQVLCGSAPWGAGPCESVLA